MAMLKRVINKHRWTSAGAGGFISFLVETDLEREAKEFVRKAVRCEGEG